MAARAFQALVLLWALALPAAAQAVVTTEDVAEIRAVTL